MKVILSSDVPNLGEEGDICTVAPGYARNFLLPKGLVMEYNARNLAVIEERRVEIEARRAERRKQAAGIKERLEAEPLVITMTSGVNGRLFGSVTGATIQEHLAKAGIDVERKRIEIPGHSIKTTGSTRVKVRLYGDQEAALTVKVEATNSREIEAEARKIEAAKAVDQALEASPVAEDPADPVQEERDPEIIAMEAAEAEAAEAEAAEAEAEAEAQVEEEAEEPLED